MSKEHVKAAKEIPDSMLRCGPRAMLNYICEKCGTGKAFTKNGKTFKVPAGRFQCTDKEMGKVLGIRRRQTLIDCRRVLKATGAVTIGYEFKQGSRYPTIVYQVDLEKLKSVCPSHTKNVCGSHADSVNPHTESDAHTGFPSETSPPPRSAKDASLQDGGVGCASAPAQRSAALRDATVGTMDAYPMTQELQASVNELRPYMEELSKIPWQNGFQYETPTEPVLVRIATILGRAYTETEGGWYLDDLYEYLSKAAWLVEKTQGRTDWLADRLESKDSRGVMAQFMAFMAGRRRHEGEGVVDEPDPSSPAARGKKFELEVEEA